MSTSDLEQIRLIRDNIHPPAHRAISDWYAFRWHRDSAGLPYTYLPQSSQAFCISVWGTLARPDAAAARLVVGNLIGDEILTDTLEATPILELEFSDRDVLNEKGLGIPTNVDALLLFPGATVVVESKLTEGFGSCSQVVRGHCTGIYGAGSDLKTLTDARCRLEVADGRRTPRRYWDLVQRLSEPDAYAVGRPCPFAGPEYQVMRNVTFAAEFAARRGTDWRVIFAFPASLSPESAIEVDRFAARLRPENQRRVLQLDYEVLATELADAGDTVSAELSRYMASRMDR